MTEVLDSLSNCSKAERSEARESAKEAEDAGVAPDPREDPLLFGALYFELKSLKDKLTRIEQKETQQTTGTQVREALKRADQLVGHGSSSKPGSVHGGNDPPGSSSSRVAKEDRQSKTDTEGDCLKVADDTLQAQKLKWMHEGKNPGVEFMRSVGATGSGLPRRLRRRGSR